MATRAFSTVLPPLCCAKLNCLSNSSQRQHSIRDLLGVTHVCGTVHSIGMLPTLILSCDVWLQL
eukprot:3506808-Amphidinium_carterae.2